MVEVEFLLHKGWTLKGNQKLVNRGSGTRIKKKYKSNVGTFFLNGNQRSQDKMSPQAMHDELLKYAEAGDIEKVYIPQIPTIHNWIGLYSSAFKHKASETSFNQ
ncbi:11549_t:CDS:1, partial [Dentiscutata heterogama]